MMLAAAHTCTKKRQKYWFEVHRLTGMDIRSIIAYSYMALDVIVYSYTHLGTRILKEATAITPYFYLILINFQACKLLFVTSTKY